MNMKENARWQAGAVSELAWSDSSERIAQRGKGTSPRLGPGSRRCLCAQCGQLFNSVSVFDLHRIGPYGANRHCLTVREMQAKGWGRSTAGVWIQRRMGREAVTRRLGDDFSLHPPQERGSSRQGDSSPTVSGGTHP